MRDTSDRIQSLDLLRGIAVIAMVMGHSIDAVLAPAARATDLFRAYDIIRGLTAPMFLFLSGFVFSVVTEKRHDVYRMRGPAASRRFARALMLLLVGYALHMPFFSLDKLLHGATAGECAQLFQVDILQCVAVTLAALQLLVMATPDVRTYGRAALLGASLVALISPVIWNVDFGATLPAFLSPYLNIFQPSIFPLIPYAAYMLAGAAAGSGFAAARREGSEERFLTRLVMTTGVLTVLGGLLVLLPVSVYPPHDVWKAGPPLIAARLFLVSIVLLGVVRVRTLSQRLLRALTPLGQHSLMVYCVHIVLVYGSVLTLGLLQTVGQTLPPLAAVAVGACVLALMVSLVNFWTYLRERHTLPLRLAQVGTVSTLVYAFIVRPY